MSRVCARVRPAELADVGSMVALTQSVDTASGVFSGRALLGPDAGHLATRFTEILAIGERNVLVAIDDVSGELVGMLVARPDEIGAIDLTPVLHVSHLIVTPKQRRRGVGRALLAGAVHLAESSGVDRVLATAASGSREGNRYLSRLGFAPLVVHRVATTAALRRALGMSETPVRLAGLRRNRVVRAHRDARVAHRGA